MCVTTAILAVAISTYAVQTAPAMLAKTATAVALAKGATASISTLILIKGALKIMAWTKTKTAIAGGTVLLVVSVGVILYLERQDISDWMTIRAGRTRRGQAHRHAH